MHKRAFHLTDVECRVQAPAHVVHDICAEDGGFAGQDVHLDHCASGGVSVADKSIVHPLLAVDRRNARNLWLQILRFELQRGQLGFPTSDLGLELRNQIDARLVSQRDEVLPNQFGGAFINLRGPTFLAVIPEVYALRFTPVFAILV